jgi:hypothetical protein
MRSFVALAALCAATASCASTGTKIETAQIQQFQKGVTTYADVVAAVGEPTSTVTDSDGKKTAVYKYAQSKIRPESFIPYVNLVAGGADVKSTAVAFRFDASDRLIDYSSTVSSVGAGYGLEAK